MDGPASTDLIAAFLASTALVEELVSINPLMSACFTLSMTSITLSLVILTPLTITSLPLETKSLNVTVFVFKDSITELPDCISAALFFKILLGIDGSNTAVLGGVSPVLVTYQTTKAKPIITPAAIKIPLLGHHELSGSSTGNGNGNSLGLASAFSKAAFPFSST